MPSKVFSYVEDGLSYTVTVYEGVDENGAPKFYADITVDEGAMDVNAIYFGDDDFSGDSEGLKGALNMNGGGSQLDGEAVQWDSAEKLSDFGLGREGTDKETYLAEGDTLTVELDIASLDEIDVFGVRATSTTTDAGSIKGVSVPEEPEDPVTPKSRRSPKSRRMTRCSSIISVKVESASRRSPTGTVRPCCPTSWSRPSRTTCPTSRNLAAA